MKDAIVGSLGFPRSAERGSIEALACPVRQAGQERRFHVRLSVAPLKRPQEAWAPISDSSFPRSAERGSIEALTYRL